jgi:hypothetical protein
MAGTVNMTLRISHDAHGRLARAAAEATLRIGRTVRVVDLVRESVATHLGIAEVLNVDPPGRPPHPTIAATEVRSRVRTRPAQAA